MDFTTKKILNNGRYILSIISTFLNTITYFIIPHFNANVAIKVVQNKSQRTFLSKSESSKLPASPSVTTTTRRRRRTRTPSTFSLKSESSILVPPPLSPPRATPTTPTPPTTTTITRTKTTRTPPVSKSESSTSAPLPSSTTTRTKTTRIPSIWKSESSTSTPPLPSQPSTTRVTTTKIPSIFSSNFESTPPPPPLALPLLPSTKSTTTPPSTFSSLFDSTPYSSPWMYSTSGDLIGSESGVFKASPSELEEYNQQYHNNQNNIPKKEKQPKNLKKEYPPPIPSQRGTLPRDVPWSLSRHNVDGRLILKDETMEYYEYLEATRENGRLVLKLIVFKGNITCHDQNDFDDDTIHADEITCDETINRREKKKRIQKEAKKESKMINRDIGTKKRRGYY